MQARCSGVDLQKFQTAEAAVNTLYGAEVKTEHAFNGIGILDKVLCYQPHQCASHFIFYLLYVDYTSSVCFFLEAFACRRRRLPGKLLLQLGSCNSSATIFAVCWCTFAGFVSSASSLIQ